MLRNIIVSFFLASALVRIFVYTKSTKQGFAAHETTLLGGRWDVGGGGMRVWFMLHEFARMGTFAAAAALVAGWVEPHVGALLFIGAGLFGSLLDGLVWPRFVWELAITMVIIVLSIIAVVLGVGWLEPHVDGWFSR